MNKNVGTIDRVARILMALALYWWALMSGAAAATGIAWWLALVVGTVMLVTALVSRCPAYRLFGLRTCRSA
jgi:hypothetical protein